MAKTYKNGLTVILQNKIVLILITVYLYPSQNLLLLKQFFTNEKIVQNRVEICSIFNDILDFLIS
jgi:hypothetical protein